MDDKLYIPGMWLPTDHVSLRQWGVKNTGKLAPCPREGFRRLIAAFEAGNREPMTLAQIRAAIKGDCAVTTPSHSGRTHSRVGASGFARWSECPGSVRVSEGLESRDSEWSDEGTRAHELLETCMRSGDDAWMHAHEDGVTEEMVGAVQMFLDTVREDLDHYGMALVEDYGTNHGMPKAVILIEHRFSLEALGHPDAFGTADVVIYFPAWSLLRVYDFKYGAGIVVDVENNGQLRYYAAGAVAEVSTNYVGIAEVESVIVQPRCEHEDGYVRRERLTVDELNAWVEAQLLPALERTKDPDAPLREGPWCRFCPAKQNAACPLLDKYHGELATVAVPAKDPAMAAKTLDDWELAERLTKATAVEMFIKALRDEAARRMMLGQEVPGFKLVQRKSNRVFKDGAETAARERWGDGAYNPPVLKSPAQIEKLPGGREFCAEWAFKPDTGLTVAPDTDKREAVRVRDAREVFAGLIGKTA